MGRRDPGGRPLITPTAPANASAGPGQGSFTASTPAGRISAGAAFARIDLALTLVRGVSADLAQRVARLLVIDEGRSTNVCGSHRSVNGIRARRLSTGPAPPVTRRRSAALALR